MSTLFLKFFSKVLKSLKARLNTVFHKDTFEKQPIERHAAR
jgi:hypothetical protein